VPSDRYDRSSSLDIGDERMSEGEAAKDAEDGLHGDDMDDDDVDGEQDDGGDKDGDAFDDAAVALPRGTADEIGLGIGGDDDMDDVSESHSVRSARQVGLAVIGRLIFLDRALAVWGGLCETTAVAIAPVFAASSGAALK
jgi:hypothetical protein